MDNFSTLVDFVANSIAVEIFALPFLVGLVFFLVGLAVLVLFVLSRTLGYRTTGTVVGAIERTRIKKKQRDGKTVEKVKKMLVPVFEYVVANGEQRQMLSSEGGSSTLSYVTGQSVVLRVREDDGYDDVYDISKHGALYFGLIIGAIGVGIMSIVGDIVAAFGVSVVLLALCAVALIVRALLAKFTGPAAVEAGAKSASSRQTEVDRKSFAPEDVHPIEYFKERKAAAEP